MQPFGQSDTKIQGTQRPDTNAKALENYYLTFFL